MKYVNNPKRLVGIVKTLAQHKLDINNYFLASLNPRINASGQAPDKIKRLFIIANADRQGKGKGNINIINATDSFNSYLSSAAFKNLTRKEASQAHKEFLQMLCNIKGMDQKTANLFLKYLVMFQVQFNIGLINWKGWEQYLDVPLDMWVLRLLGNRYLDVCTAGYEQDFKNKDDYMSPGYSSQKYIDLQAEIKNVSSQGDQPAITLDGLWFVGSKFCSYRPLLCDVCWLKNDCSADKNIPWPETPPPTKPEEKAIRKEREKQIREISKMLTAWKTSNPGKSDEDFFRTILYVPDGGDNTPSLNE